MGHAAYGSSTRWVITTVSDQEREPLSDTLSQRWQEPYRLMVVDAADHLRTFLATVFEQDPRFTVVGQAAEAGQAVACARRTRPDVALLDRYLPEVDGLDALPHIRAAVPDCVVVVLSGDDTPPRPAEADTAELMVKGLTPPRLAEEVWRILQHPASGGGTADSADSVAELQMVCEPQPQSAQAARRFVREALAGWQRPDLVDDVVLLTCELVTNAIVHARSRSTLRITLVADRVRVTVEDPGRETPRMDDAGRQHVSGRGLHLVEALATSWGTVAAPRRKAVWFER